MNALNLTMSDLTRALGLLHLDDALLDHAEQAAKTIERGLAERGQPATASVSRGADGLSIDIAGPRLWDREHGTTTSEGEGNLDVVLRERRGA